MKLDRLFLMGLLITFGIQTGCSDDGGNGGDSQITQLSNLPLSGRVTDIWGYVDNAGKEYAIVGFGIFSKGIDSGIHIIDVSDAENPVLVSTVTSVPGFDVKVWQNYAYTTNGSGDSTGGVVDLSDPANPQVVGSFPSSHNITIADGYMYLENPGVRIFNLNANAIDPPLIWSGGNASDGHDATVIDNRLYDFHGWSATNIYDISDPANPQLLASWDAPAIRYNHSGWPTQDGRHLFICDELAQDPDADFTVWDITNLNNPNLVGQFNDPNATIHNLFIIEDFAYTSYYGAGFRIFDVSDPTQPTLVDEFDTSTFNEEGFADGAWGVYPFAPSGNIYVSDQSSGLHIFSFNKNSANSNRVLAP